MPDNVSRIPTHQPPPLVLRRPDLPIHFGDGIETQQDSNGQIVRAWGKSNGKAMSLEISGTAPNQTAAFVESGEEFLSITATFQPLGIRDPVDPAWAGRILFLLDVRTPTCWLRYELVPPVFGSDAKLRPFAASKSVPTAHGWKIVEAAAGTFDPRTSAFRTFPIDVRSIGDNPGAALVAHHLPGLSPNLSAEANIGSELARAQFFASVFHPATETRALRLTPAQTRFFGHLLAGCIGGGIAGSIASWPGATLGCLGGSFVSVWVDVIDIVTTETPPIAGGGGKGGAPSGKSGGDSPNPPKVKDPETTKH